MAFSHPNTSNTRKPPCCSQSGLPVNEDSRTEVGSGLQNYGCLSERLTNPPDAPDMEDNGCACVVGAFFKASLKPTSLLRSLMRSEQPAGCISSLNTGHTVIINFSGVTCASKRYLFPEKTCRSHRTRSYQYFNHWARLQKKLLSLMSSFKACYHDLKNSNIINVHTLKISHRSFSATLSLHWTCGVNCLGGSSCEATRVAGELSVALSKHMSLPHGFVLLPKDVTEMSLNETQTTMKR